MFIAKCLIAVALLFNAGDDGARRCHEAAELAGLCVSYSGGGLVVGGSHTVPGGGGSVAPPVDVDGPGNRGSVGFRIPEDAVVEDGVACWSAGGNEMAGGGMQTCLEVGEGVEPGGDPFAAITASDLASFAPPRARILAEPSGWAVAGTPANFVADASAQIVDGLLFSAPIQVRWTPVEFRWDYGDGKVATLHEPGTAWTDATRFTEGPSTHSYRDRTDRTVQLHVAYRAEVDAGGGWRAVPGTLATAAEPRDVRVFSVRTSLTRGNCLEYPNDPGCG